MNGTLKTETDVVIVGGGGSGLSAAIEAARGGAQVILLEKNPRLGGTTARSVGSITATQTALQAAEGIDDSPDGHFEDLALFARAVGLDPDTKDNLELRRVLVDEAPNTIRFLTDMGVIFFGPMPEPPHKKPRMHNVLPHSGAYIYHLSRHAKKAGVDVRVNAEATRLLSENGRVAGVEAKMEGGGLHRFLARKGVVVAAGDYSSSTEMKARYVAPDLAGVEGINPTSTGDGQRLLLEVGAQIVNGDVMLGPEIRFVAPPRKTLIEILPPSTLVARFVKLSMDYMPDWLLRPFLMMFVTTNLAPSHKLFEEGAILVNKEGKRFVDENENPQFTIPAQPDKIAYIVFDDQIASKFSGWPYFISTAPGVAYAYLPDYRRNRKDIYHQAPTLEALAAKLGIPEAELKKTVADLNESTSQASKDGSDGHTRRSPLAQPPFHALGPAKSWIVLTDGGARVTPRLEVLNGDGKVIPGLYAAGSSGQGGVLLEGHGHHLGWAFTSGRIAGRSVVSANE